MASLKRIGVWDIQLGMVIVKCDKAGVPFNEYGRPLSNLGYIHSLHDYGVEHVYIWSEQDSVAEPTAEKTSTKEKEKSTKIEFRVNKDDDVNAILLSAASELVTMLKSNFTESMAGLKMGKAIDAPAVISVVSDIVFMSNDNPEVFTKIALNEGMSKDEFTHGLNVCINAVSLGMAVGIKGKELHDLGLAGLLHDIGKVRVPEQILNKKSGLSDYEMAALKRHPEYAGQVLQRYENISEDVLNIIYQHHECCDGSGYPSGINSQYILKPSKVLAIAEAYNTMLMYSPEYPRAFNNTDAIKKIYAEAGKKYQADIVKTFVSIMGVYPVGTAVSLSNGNVGIVCEINKQDQSKPKVLMMHKDDTSKIELVNLKTHPNIKIVKEINNTDLNINTFEIFNSFLKSRISHQVEKI